MGTVVTFVPLPRWQHSMTGKLRSKKSRPSSLLISAWFNKHGPFRAKISSVGGLILEHDDMPSIPPAVIADLKNRAVIWYFSGDEKLEAEDEFHSWLVGGQHAQELKFIPPLGMRERMPKGVTCIAIVLKVGRGRPMAICVIDHVEDLRKAEPVRKSQSGG